MQSDNYFDFILSMKTPDVHILWVFKSYTEAEDDWR